MGSGFTPNWVYLLYYKVLFSKEWLAMLSMSVLHTSPAKDSVMWPTLWYIILSYEQLHLFWVSVPLQLSYWRSHFLLSSVSKKCILVGLNNDVWRFRKFVIFDFRRCMLCMTSSFRKTSKLFSRHSFERNVIKNLNLILIALL